MILNPSQVQKCLMERAALMRALLQTEEDRDTLLRYRGREDILSGSQGDWDALAKSHAHCPSSVALPAVGHVFIAAAVEPNARMLKRLLFDLGVDVERSWQIPGFEHPWSAWIWAASTVRDDGSVQPDVIRNTWEILLPHLLAAGMSLSEPMKNGKTRRSFLQREAEARLDEAYTIADQLKLQWSTSPSCNSASRRL